MFPMVLKNLIRFFFLCLYCFCFSAFSDVVIRTDKSEEKTLIIAIDFNLKSGEHITAPVDKGISISPKLTFGNAQVIDEVWPDSEILPNSDGTPSDYFGYSKNFTVYYKLKIIDQTLPINYQFFYVVCSNSCKPCEESSVIKQNGLLLDDEIKKIGFKNELNETKTLNFGIVIFFGFLGGIILNFMPCVFPVVSLKIFSFMNASNKNKKEIRYNSIFVSLGIIFTFLTLGMLLLLIRQNYPGIGWGFFMQDPVYIFYIFLLFIFCSLNFFGILPLSFSVGSIKFFDTRSKYINSFFSGILGGISSSACVGPFSGIALGSAFLYGTTLESILIFISLGAGVSLPFLLLSIYPNLTRFFPRPGQWMISLKTIMGFLMLFSASWFFWILTEQLQSSAILNTLLITIAIAMFTWLYFEFHNIIFNKIFSMLSVICLIILGTNVIEKKYNTENTHIINYSDKIFEDAVISQKPFILNFTAAWCLNCKINEILFDSVDIQEFFKKNGILIFKCDWTNRNDKITNILKKYGSVSVPFNVYYPGNGRDYKILPSILSKSKLHEVINEK